MLRFAIHLLNYTGMLVCLCGEKSVIMVRFWSDGDYIFLSNTDITTPALSALIV